MEKDKLSNELVEFIEYLENDLKSFANLTFYNYEHSDATSENIHQFIFEISKEKLTNEDVKKIEKIINTYDEGAITYGVIHFGSIYVTIVGTD